MRAAIYNDTTNKVYQFMESTEDTISLTANTLGMKWLEVTTGVDMRKGYSIVDGKLVEDAPPPESNPPA